MNGVGVAYYLRVTCARREKCDSCYATGGGGGGGGGGVPADPLEDPVLMSYSRMIAADVLCVWRKTWRGPQDTPSSPHMSQHQHHHAQHQLRHSLRHSPKELWVFWYGDEPDLTNLLAPELLRYEPQKKVSLQPSSFEIMMVMRDLLKRFRLAVTVFKATKMIRRPPPHPVSHCVTRPVTPFCVPGDPVGGERRGVAGEERRGEEMRGGAGMGMGCPG
ncbi:Mediator of RNA polymerase II transcription subunit 13 [Portunus trituberculatus]|uniref:Mediator of RNA polymerase II transcription subunit 13 n=1 Tax=Portunus trituberculatus TaxID=210409 RepID=A0A5B7GGM6_PORTR|nr:Mediator of RNA polymerase II transcription subunit 13 [Portunus trituberculatus]